MKKKCEKNRAKTLKSFLRDDRGQVIPWVCLMLICILGVVAMVTDIGHAMICYRELQAGTNAAALAGGQELPNSDYVTVAEKYSSTSGDYNANSNLQSVNTTVTGECLTTVKNWGIPCSSPANDNAVQVTQTASVPTYFAKVLGISSIPLSVTATAAERGSVAVPYNIAILVDTTQSMNDTDSDSQCSTTRIKCALSGVQTLLEGMSACSYSLSSCGSVTSGSSGAGNVSNAIDHVALFTFPNATQSTISDDYGCNGSNPSPQGYTFPTAGASSYAPGSSTATYEVVGFSSDFKTSGSTSSLSTSSDIVKSVGGKSGCDSMSAEGGEGTYYAGAIYAAQAALEAEQTDYPSAGNVMILISDGDASDSESDGMSGSSSTGAYGSYVDECNQAVAAAKLATSEGTRVYTVAYGAESSGCTSSGSGGGGGGGGRGGNGGNGGNGGGSSGETAAMTVNGWTYMSNITPCETMENIASSSSYFYSDYTQSGSGGDSSCVGSADSTSNLSQIFTDIANSLTTSRLIPNITS